jgi:hypothetical protein
MPRSIFREIGPPKRTAKLAINEFSTWHTWSDEFCAFLVRAADEFAGFPAPPIMRLNHLSEYNYTFSLLPAEWKDSSLCKEFEAFVRSLAGTRPRRKLMLFDRLLGPHLDGQKLRVLFALTRGTLVQMANSEFAAMYAPLGNIGVDVGDFLLHADLYVPQYLFNVFDNVRATTGGASTFLPVPRLKQIATQVKMPSSAARTLLSMFEKDSKSDRFEKCFDLLHGEHRWVPQMEECFAAHQLKIPLRSGQGYLLHDRSWLHGRNKPTGGVEANRVHRLIYGM